jgi:hypothetical protein
LLVMSFISDSKFVWSSQIQFFVYCFFFILANIVFG